MMRFASRSGTGPATRSWDIGVPEGDENTSGEYYSFAIDDPVLGTDPELIIRWDTGNVGIGVTDPVTKLHVNGTVTATAFQGRGVVNWQTVSAASQVAAPNTGYLITYAGETTITLPTSAVAGDIIRITGAGNHGWRNRSRCRFRLSLASLNELDGLGDDGAGEFFALETG